MFILVIVKNKVKIFRFILYSMYLNVTLINLISGKSKIYEANKKLSETYIERQVSFLDNTQDKSH